MISVQYNFPKLEHEIYKYYPEGMNTYYEIATGIERVPWERGQLLQPFISLGDREIQEFVDALDSKGITAQEGYKDAVIRELSRENDELKKRLIWFEEQIMGKI